MAALDSAFNRRLFLCGLGAAVLAPWPAQGAERLIGRLIATAQPYPTVSKRIEVISHALIGHRYQANTLIGGPRKREVFVTRDDKYDCVTFCETVLAAARSHDLPSFEMELRAIRYRNGAVDWRERNHDFAAWCVRNTENGICRPVPLGETVDLKKTLEWPRTLGRRSYEIAALPSATLLVEKEKLQSGDIVGFVSRRTSLDYFHTGLLMFDAKGELLLRHASESHRRVVDERMTRFLAVNGVRYVTVLRPREIVV